MKKFGIQQWLSRFLDNLHIAQQADDCTNEEYEAFEEMRNKIFDLDAKRRGIRNDRA